VRSSPGPESKKKRLMWYSVFGPVKVHERVWRTPERSHLRLLPEALGISHRGCSRCLRRVLVDFGSDYSFDHSRGKVKEHYGFEISASAVRQATLACAAEVAGKQAREAEGDYNALPAGPGPAVVLQADGSMVCTVAPGPRSGARPRQYEEIRLAAAQAQGSVATTYAASFAAVEDLGRRWGHCARDAGRTLASVLHPMGDGAGWIARQARAIFGTRVPFPCDFHHVKDQLRAAAPGCRAHAPDQWRRTQQRRLKRNALDLVLKELTTHRETDSVAEEDAPVRAAERYLSNRRDQLDYAGAIERGLPIGTGMIESGHKHVLQARLKLPGCAWLKENAANIAQLRVFRSNRRWPQLWN